MTWGAGTFQERSIASLIEEFESTKEIESIKENEVDIEDIAKKLWKFMTESSDAFFKGIPLEGRPKTGLIIGGYTKRNFFPNEYAMIVPTKEPYKPRPDINRKPNFGANWYGMTDAINRFHHGWDERIVNILLKNGIAEEILSKIRNQVSTEMQYAVPFNAMPLKDAIQYAKFLIELTIARYKYVLGAELCGGSVQTATITRKEGFQLM